MKSIWIITLALIAEARIANPGPSTALILRSTRDATNGAAVFGDLSSNDSTININLETNVPWENLIMPAPAVINLLGQLMVISSKIDVSLVQNEPRGGFKYMRHPESFRASLVQVSNDGWSAFMNAHSNMDRIQLYMQQIPGHVKTAIRLIEGASPRVIELLLPTTIDRIHEIGERCVQLSNETARKFEEVMYLLHELLAVTESSRGTHERKLAEAEIALNVTATYKQYLETIGDQIKKRQEAVERQVTKYRQDYDRAMSDIPTGWKTVGLSIGMAFANLINAVPQMVGSMSFGINIRGPITRAPASAPMNNQQSQPSAMDKTLLFTYMQGVLQFVSQLKDVVSKAFDGTSSENPAQMFTALSVNLDMAENVVKTGQQDADRSKALQLINEGKGILRDLSEIFNRFPLNLNGTDSDTILERLTRLEEQLKPMVTQGIQLSNGMSAALTQPGQQSGSSGGIDFSGIGANERYKAYMSLQNLREAETRLDKIIDDMTKYHEEMKVLITKLANLNLERINYQEICELLKEGVKRLAGLQKQWQALVEFFKFISNRADTVLKRQVADFVDKAQKTEQNIGRLTADDRKWLTGELHLGAVGINRVAYFLYILSSTYYEVSNRFIMHRLAGLSEMLATDNESERKRLLTTLARQANEAQDAIKQMAQQRRQEYKRLVQRRKTEALRKYENSN